MTNEELVAFVKKNPISVGCGAFALLVAVGIYFRSSEIPEAEALLAEKSAEAERYALNIKNSAQLKEQYEAVVAANKDVDTRIVRASQKGNNTQFFYKLQNDTGVRLIDFRQSEALGTASKTKTTFTPIAFNVSVQGTLPQILDFLRQLEGGTHYSRILSASCTSSPTNRGGPLTLALSLELLGLP